KEKKEDDFNARAALNRANRLAGRGALSRSVPVYEKILEHAHEKHTSAHFNLAEVLRAKKEYARALIHYQAYLNLGDDAGTRSDAEAGIEKLKASVWDKKFATLSVNIEPTKQSTIAIDGFVVAENGPIDEMEVLAGEYTIRADAKDYHPDEKTVSIDNQGSASVSFDLEKKTFFGKATVSVDEKGATVKFHPKDLDAPDGPEEPVVKKSPLEKPVELETGKWLVEVTKPGFHRWVRYIKIKRDKEKVVNVELSEKLPEEIR
ncbi:MAG: hypothetical protein ABEN55_08045, partial [Bradymonadaceae bacterium]